MSQQIKQEIDEKVGRFYGRITDFDAPINCDDISKDILAVPGVASVGIHSNDFLGIIDANVELWSGECFTVRIAGGEDNDNGDDGEEIRIAA